MVGYIFGGDTGETYDSLKRKREINEALLKSSTDGVPRNVGEGLAAVARALSGRWGLQRVQKEEGAARDKANSAFDSVFKSLMGPTTRTDTSTPTPVAPTMENARSADRASVPGYSGLDMKSGITAAADALGISPIDLATTISYETGGTMDPTKAGPTTQWGQHRGLIQFGEPQAKKYGVNWADPINSQLGREGAIVKYLRDAGVKPGMGLMDIYSAINAGQVGKYNATDENNGGAPGTAADKVNTQMDAHRARALEMFGQDAAPSVTGQPVQVADNSSGISPNMVELLRIGSDPYLPPEKKALVQALIQREQAQQAQALKQSDPAYQMGLQADQLAIEKTRRELANMDRKPRLLTPAEVKQAGLDPSGSYQDDGTGKISVLVAPQKPANDDWIQLDDGRLLNKRTAEVRTPEAVPGVKTGFRFKGNSVDAQALNGLLDAGKITEEQAQQIAAGKTVSGPNGELIFLTPQGITSQMPGQQPGQQPAQDQGVDLFGTAPKVAPAAPVDQPATDAAPAKNPGMVQLTEPKVTIDQSKAMTFADRLSTSGQIIDNFGAQDPGIWNSTVSSIPIAGNYLVSDDYQQLDQAKRDFINAQLRRESGASISPGEFDNANKQYFPQPGDKPEVLAQKARNRRIVTEGMMRDAGPTYKPPKIEAAKKDEIPPAPAGVDPDLWMHMTPEERKQWQN